MGLVMSLNGFDHKCVHQSEIGRNPVRDNISLVGKLKVFEDVNKKDEDNLNIVEDTAYHVDILGKLRWNMRKMFKNFRIIPLTQGFTLGKPSKSL